jgi:hypothetical protein
MANPGRIVVEIGKALGKAVIAGVGLELARIATRAVRDRFSGPDEDGDGGGSGGDGGDVRRARGPAPRTPPTATETTKTTTTTTTAAPSDDSAPDDVEALRRENAALRAELGALRRDRRTGRDER